MRRSLGPASTIPSAIGGGSVVPSSSSGSAPSSTVIAVVNAGNVAAAGAAAASRESLSLDSGNQSPDTTSGPRLSTSLTDSRSADADSLLADEEHQQHQQLRAPSSEITSTSANTHIIRVSGPVTNLDETVLSANNILMSTSMGSSSLSGATAGYTSSSSGGAAGKDKKNAASGGASSQSKTIPEVATHTSV